MLDHTINMIRAFNGASIAAETVVSAATSAPNQRRYRMFTMTVASSVAGNVIFRDGVAGTILVVVPCQPGVGIYMDLGDGVVTARGNALTVQGPAGCLLSGTVLGAVE